MQAWTGPFFIPYTYSLKNTGLSPGGGCQDTVRAWARKARRRDHHLAVSFKKSDIRASGSQRSSGNLGLFTLSLISRSATQTMPYGRTASNSPPPTRRRARWKIENEHIQTLKIGGYRLKHNFGHGKRHLSNLLVSISILAFLMHTALRISRCPFPHHPLPLRLPDCLLSGVFYTLEMASLQKLGSCHRRRVRQSPSRYRLSVLPIP